MKQIINWLYKKIFIVHPKHNIKNDLQTSTAATNSYSFSLQDAPITRRLTGIFTEEYSIEDYHTYLTEKYLDNHSISNSD